MSEGFWKRYGEQWDRLLGGKGRRDVFDSVDANWHFVAGWIPLPLFDVKCPICETDRVQFSRITWRPHGEGTIKHRADVSFKCQVCSAFWSHGVPLNAEQFAAAAGGRRVTLRSGEIREQIKAARGGDREND